MNGRARDSELAPAPAPGLPLRSAIRLLATALATACGDSARPAPDVAVRDSGGVAIVDNPTAAATLELPWTVATEPSVVIGVVDGAPEYQLHRITGAARLSDGRIAVVNAGSGEIRFYDAAGSFLAAVGGEGEGPGEFRDMALVDTAPGDSLLLYDPRLQRFTWVTAAPAIGRSFPSSDSAGGRLQVLPHGRLGSGRIVASGRAIAEGTPSSGVRDPFRPLLVLDTGGTVRDTLGRYTHEPRHVWATERMVSIARVPYGSVTGFAVGAEAIHVAPADDWEIRTLDGDGRLARLVRLHLQPRPVTATDVEAAIAEVLGRTSLSPADAREQHEMMEIPDRMPAHGRVLLDRDDHLWVEEYRAPGEAGPARWWVVDPEGRVLGVVALPGGLEVQEIGGDYVLGVALDELDTPRVVLYELDRE